MQLDVQHLAAGAQLKHLRESKNSGMPSAQFALYSISRFMERGGLNLYSVHRQDNGCGRCLTEPFVSGYI